MARISSKKSSNGMVATIAEAMETIYRVKDWTEDRGYADATFAARAEPLNLITDDLRTWDGLPGLNAMTLKTTALMYASAVPLASNTISSMVIRDTIDRLNPNVQYRTILEEAAIESDKSETAMIGAMMVGDKFIMPSVESSVNAKITDTGIPTVAQIDITLTNKETGSLTIPVLMRLQNLYPPAALSVGIMSKNMKDLSFSGRWLDYRVGNITLLSDLILGSDLIDDEKKLHRLDPDGIYEEIIKRSTKTKIVGAVKRLPSLATATNVFTISENAERALNRRIKGSLDKAKMRSQVFSNTKAMIIQVVDRENEVVTIYYRGNANSTELTFKEISKSSGTDELTDALKRIASGFAPNF